MKFRFQIGLIALTSLLAFVSFNSLASGEAGLHQTVTNLLSKHAVKRRNGQFNGYITKSLFNYHADQCELRIKRVLQWRHTRTDSTSNHGASYRIPLKKVKLERGRAVNRIKLACGSKECIEKRLHKTCKSRRCRRDKTVSAYYLQIRPDFKEYLAQHLGKLVRSCNTN